MIWNAEEEKKLVTMWVLNVTVKNISSALGRPETTVRGKVKRLGLSARRRAPSSTRPEPPKVLRKCLKCRASFMAERQYFVCKKCKSTNEWRGQGGVFSV
jgi:hypothetical protein